MALATRYGHLAAYDTLEEAVRRHLDPIGSLYYYDCESKKVVPSREVLDALDFLAMNDLAMNDTVAVAGIVNANELVPTILSEDEVRDFIAFLHA